MVVWGPLRHKLLLSQGCGWNESVLHVTWLNLPNDNLSFFFYQKKQLSLWLIENVEGVTPHSGGRGCFIYTFLGSVWTLTHPPTSSLTHTSIMHNAPHKTWLSLRGPAACLAFVPHACLLLVRNEHSPHLIWINLCPGEHLAPVPCSIQASVVEFYWKVCRGKLLLLLHHPTSTPPPKRARGGGYIVILLHSNKIFA